MYEAFRFQLVIYDNDHPAVCSSINDPHITTFDGRFVLFVFSVITAAIADADEKCFCFCCYLGNLDVEIEAHCDNVLI